MRMGIVLRMTEALTALVLATPHTRNKDAAPGSSNPITKGRQPMRRKSRAYPAASANRNITPAPIENRNPVISATARASIIAFWAMTVAAQQADAKTRASGHDRFSRNGGRRWEHDVGFASPKKDTAFMLSPTSSGGAPVHG